MAGNGNPRYTVRDRLKRFNVAVRREMKQFRLGKGEKMQSNSPAAKNFVEHSVQ